MTTIPLTRTPLEPSTPSARTGSPPHQQFNPQRLSLQIPTTLLLRPSRRPGSYWAQVGLRNVNAGTTNGGQGTHHHHRAAPNKVRPLAARGSLGEEGVPTGTGSCFTTCHPPPPSSPPVPQKPARCAPSGSSDPVRERCATVVLCSRRCRSFFLHSVPLCQPP